MTTAGATTAWPWRAPEPSSAQAAFMQGLKLGTRGSLLAIAQSRLVRTALQQLHPDLPVEVVTVVTRGDRDQLTPLQDVKDPDFFSAELDVALLGGRVDFCVHSLKDLPSVRPAGIATAVLPRRENPRDVIVWRGDVPARLAAGERLRLGSSSPRRHGNVADFLAYALPASGRAPLLDFLPVRGAVDKRLVGLHRPRTAADALDGVVLALAGLARLWSDPDGRKALGPLLADCRWMVLPLTRCPAAAGQGVLAVECRADDDRVRNVLRSLHDPDTAELVAVEAAALTGFDSTDRAALGATAIRHAELGPVCFLRGHTSAGVVERLDWHTPAPPNNAVGFDGLAWQRACTRHPAGPLPELRTLRPGDAVFAAYWHALQEQTLPPGVRLWVSGVESWRRLAARGLWVEGCGDHLGFGDVRATLECPVLGLPPLRDWTALTYRSAVPGWLESGVGNVLETYAILPPADPSVVDSLRESARQATHFYWSSAEQFHALRPAVPPGAHHACGAGKTLRVLRAAGTDARPFPNGREWQRWVHG